MEELAATSKVGAVEDLLASAAPPDPEYRRLLEALGRYRELATNRDVAYVEEKGETCTTHGHRRNHTISDRATTAPLLTAVRSA